MALISRLGSLSSVFRKPIAAVGFVVRTSARTAVTSDPVIITGSGDPDDDDGNPIGSLYLRQLGGAGSTLYAKTAAATWTAMTGS
jgi:hypothetical protein